MTTSSRDLLVQTIGTHEARLVEFDRATEEVRLQLKWLRTELGALDSAVSGRAQ